MICQRSVRGVKYVGSLMQPLPYDYPFYLSPFASEVIYILTFRYDKLCRIYAVQIPGNMSRDHGRFCG